MITTISRRGKVGATGQFVRSVAPFTSPLPMLHIDTEGGVPINPSSGDVPASWRLAPPGRSQNPAQTYSATGIIATRGNTSNPRFATQQNFKFQYKLEPAVKGTPFGWPSYDKFICHSDVFDHTFLRNSLVFQIVRSFGFWAPRCQKVEFTINGEYRGPGTFMESIDQDPGRVNVAKNSVTSNPNFGFIISKDHYGDAAQDPADIYFQAATTGEHFLFKYPKAKNLKVGGIITNAISANGQINIDYAKAKVDAAEAALFGSGYANSSTGWRAHLDEMSMFVWTVIAEMSKGFDQDVNSLYFAWTTNGKLFYIPWDFDYTFGDMFEPSLADPTGWLYNGPLADTRLQYRTRLMTDSTHVAFVKAQWAIARSSNLSNAALNAWLDAQVGLLSPGPASRNQQRWHNFTTPRTTPDLPVPGTYKNAMRIFRTFLFDRLAWMDSQWL